jgi:ABC-type branched-subunit amino acid transport system substrate-binding protein
MLAKYGPLVLALAASGGCSGRRAHVTIETVASELGELATSGQGTLQAAQLAVEEINAAGGVLGGTFELDVHNDSSEPATIPGIAAQILDSAKMPAVFCCDGSGLTIPMSTFTIPAHVVQISSASTAPAITTIADDDLLFRTCPSDELQARLIARRARDRGFGKMAIAFIPNPYGMGLSDAFASSFTALGGTITLNQPMSIGASSYGTLLGQLLATHPDAILLATYPLDGAQMIRDYNARFSGTPVFWYFTDALEVSAFVTGVGGGNFTFAHEGTHSSAPPGDAYGRYAAAYVARWRQPDDPGTYSPNAYDAMYVLALAIEQAGKADSGSIHQALRIVANPPGAVFGPGQFAAARAALKSGMDINYEGASGSIDFDANGDVPGLYDVWAIVGGGITILEHAASP